MEDKKLALEIAKRFIGLENEVRALRTVLRRSWTQETPFEDFVQKGISQLQVHETTHQKYDRLESAFLAHSEDGTLMQTLRDELLHVVKIE